MGKISNVVGKMPFAGKSAVENAALNAIGERTSVQEKAAKAIKVAGFLTVFGAMHGVQAKMGMNELEYNLDQFQDGVTPLEVGQTAVSSLYTLANSAVLYTQFQIAGRVLRNFHRFRRDHQNGEPFAAADYDFDVREATGTQLAATSAGQAIFLAQFMSHQ